MGESYITAGARARLVCKVSLTLERLLDCGVCEDSLKDVIFLTLCSQEITGANLSPVN